MRPSQKLFKKPDVQVHLLQTLQADAETMSTSPVAMDVWGHSRLKTCMAHVKAWVWS